MFAIPGWYRRDWCAFLKDPPVRSDAIDPAYYQECLLKRTPTNESSRIGVCECTWRRHVEFANDIGRVRIDANTWAALKAQMRRAALGTVRQDEWEYPCASTRGAIGELRYDEAAEVDVITPTGVTVETTTIHYRIYFAEPPLCPEELWAMCLGAKSWHAAYVGTEQQDDIDLAQLRANTTSSRGEDLHDLPV